MNRLVGVGAIALGAVLVLAFFIFRGPEQEAVPETVTEPEAPAIAAEPEAAPAAAEPAAEPEPAAVAEANPTVTVTVAEPEPVAIAESEIESGAGVAEEPAATKTVRATVSGAEPVEPNASESVEAALPDLLRTGGALLLKILESPEAQAIERRLRARFERAKTTTTAATRKGSSERYLLARGFRGAG